MRNEESNAPQIYHFEEPRNSARDYVLAVIAQVAFLAGVALLLWLGEKLAAFVEGVQA